MIAELSSSFFVRKGDPEKTLSYLLSPPLSASSDSVRTTSDHGGVPGVPGVGQVLEDRRGSHSGVD